jgi:glycosyltransferase involved in cell wall biosynthesis
VLDRVIVVDDASGDDTAARLAEFRDSRVVVHVRAENGGIGAARRDAAERCSASWTVMMDSDHELLPGALRTLSLNADAVPPRVGIIGARFRWDTGAVTPQHLPDHPIDYEDRIRWSARRDSIGSDYLCCMSRHVRERALWSTHRSGLVDTLFQLDAARLADASFIPECLAYQKSNGAEGHSRGTAVHMLARRKKDARGGVALCREILDRHGPALERLGRPILADVLKDGATCAALLGQRFLAARWAARVGRRAVAANQLSSQRVAGPAVFSWASRRRSSAMGDLADSPMPPARARTHSSTRPATAQPAR